MCIHLCAGCHQQASLQCSTNGYHPKNGGTSFSSQSIYQHCYAFPDVYKCGCNVTSLSSIERFTVTCDNSSPSSSGSKELCCTSEGVLLNCNTRLLTFNCSIIPSSTPPSSTTTESPTLSSEATKTTPAQTAMIKQSKTTTIHSLQTTMLTTKPSTKVSQVNLCPLVIERMSYLQPLPDHSLLIVTGVAGGTLLALLLTSIIVLCVVMNWKKKRGHSLREGETYIKKE